MTLAELKRRLLPGIRLRLVHCLTGPCDKGRTVKCQQFNSIAFWTDDVPAKVSWLHWPKARNLREAPDGFEIIVEGFTGPAARYVWCDMTDPRD